MSEVAQSDDTIPSYIGTGAPTVTSMDGIAGTGIVWITSRDGELNAYRAVPASELAPSDRIQMLKWEKMESWKKFFCLRGLNVRSFKDQLSATAEFMCRPQQDILHVLGKSHERIRRIVRYQED